MQTISSRILYVIGVKQPTWLILPVVIRSSQRLSHACLSSKINFWNCEWLITTALTYSTIPYYLNNCSNSRANTCFQSLTLLKGFVCLLVCLFASLFACFFSKLKHLLFLKLKPLAILILVFYCSFFIAEKL